MRDEATLRSYVARFRNKASVLTRIHSALANRNKAFDTAHTVSIVALTALITFLGFIGTDRILEAVGSSRVALAADASTASAQSQNPNASAALVASSPRSGASAVTDSPPAALSAPTFRKATFDFFFNLSVLLLFVASLLNLIFRWKERYTSHFQGVVKLKQYIGWLDELALLGLDALDLDRIRAIRNRYQAIVELLPPNSDRDYRRAKERMKNEKAAKVAEPQSQSLRRGDCALLVSFVERSPEIMEVLRVISAMPGNLWLGGGSARNLAWDRLTKRTTPGHDFDVVYFDASALVEQREKEIEEDIRAKLPRTFTVSVKNQARMHQVTGEPERVSLEDSIANWPETATACALRINANGQLEILAPYGCGDILNMILRPTPYHAANRVAFERRLKQKAWQEHWPELELRDDPPSTGTGAA